MSFGDARFCWLKTISIPRETTFTGRFAIFVALRFSLSLKLSRSLDDLPLDLLLDAIHSLISFDWLSFSLCWRCWVLLNE